MGTKYFGFKDREDLWREFNGHTYNNRPFEPEADFPAEDEIIVAWYDTPPYEGSAFVLYKKDGKLFEVNGGHCSCMGLEDQWAPEETSVEALKMRAWYQSYDDDAAFESVKGILSGL